MDKIETIGNKQFVKDIKKNKEESRILIHSLFLVIGTINLFCIILQIIINAGMKKLESAITINSIVSLLCYLILVIIIGRKIYKVNYRFEDYEKLSINLIVLIKLVFPILFLAIRMVLVALDNNAVSGSKFSVYSDIEAFATILLFCIFLIDSFANGKASKLVRVLGGILILVLYFSLVHMDQAGAADITVIASKGITASYCQVLYLIINSIGFIGISYLYNEKA